MQQLNIRSASFSLIVFFIFWFRLYSLSVFENIIHLNLVEQWVVFLFLPLILVALLLYKLIKRANCSPFLLLLNLFSLFIFIQEEHFGTHYRNALLGAILIAALIASFHKKDWQMKAVWYAQQLIIATYFLSAISKITASGLDWYADADHLVLQIIKSCDQLYVDEGNDFWLGQKDSQVSILLNYSGLVQFLLFLSFLLELLIPILLLKRKWIPIYGLLLLGMHIGIFVLMDIFIPPIVLPMIAFFINPLQQITLLFNRIKR